MIIVGYLKIQRDNEEGVAVKKIALFKHNMQPICIIVAPPPMLHIIAIRLKASLKKVVRLSLIFKKKSLSKLLLLEGEIISVRMCIIIVAPPPMLYNIIIRF